MNDFYCRHAHSSMKELSLVEFISLMDDENA